MPHDADADGQERDEAAGPDGRRRKGVVEHCRHAMQR